MIRAADHFAVDDEGRIGGLPFIASPNCDARPPGMAIELLVIHAISLPRGIYQGDAVERLFTNTLDPAAHTEFAPLARLRVSAHFFIRRDGRTLQFVRTLDRAWHAGVSCWRGRRQCNDFSIGIELEGCDDQPFAEAQYAVLAGLTLALAARYPIEAIVGHADIAPGRKTDPGRGFDWRRLAATTGLTGFIA